MKISLSIVFVLLFYFFCTAQRTLITKPITGNNTNIRKNFSNSVNITDMQGRPIKNKYEGVQGSAFFRDYYCIGNIRTINGKYIDSLLLKIDLFNNDIYFFNDNNDEVVLKEGIAKKITITDSLSGKQFQFQTGFPANRDKTSKNYYQIFCEGKLVLLQSIVKKINTKKDEMSGEQKQEFDSYEDYFIFYENKFFDLKKNKDFILGFCADKKEQMEAFALQNKSNFKKIDDIITLINYYNSL